LRFPDAHLAVRGAESASRRRSKDCAKIARINCRFWVKTPCYQHAVPTGLKDTRAPIYWFLAVLSGNSDAPSPALWRDVHNRRCSAAKPPARRPPATKPHRSEIIGLWGVSVVCVPLQLCRGRMVVATMENCANRIEVKWKKWLPFNSSAPNGQNVSRVVSA
jgi:hypothetical protein